MRAAFMNAGTVHLALLGFGAIALAGVPLLGDDPSKVVGSKHDLSVTGGGPVRSDSSQACVFCHGSHLPEGSMSAGQTPLWNRDLPVQVYPAYVSSTLDAKATEGAAGSTQLCMSCHDGTIAPGQTLTRGAVPTRGSMESRNMSSAGRSLAKDHPVGITPRDDGQLHPGLFQMAATTADSDVRLRDGRIECITCHTPHEPARDPLQPSFLARSNRDGELCLACHDPSRPQPNTLSGWRVSAHATVSNTVPSNGPWPAYGSVASNACSSCHVTHARSGTIGARNLRAREEEGCLSCHGGENVLPAIANVRQDLSRTYAHPTLAVSGVHDPVGDGAPVSADRHAECADCHNPHAAGGPAGVNPPSVSSALQGATGYNGFAAVVPAVSQYEVCYKCHADSPNKPQVTTGAGRFGWTVRRQSDQFVSDPSNTRLEFESTVSRHNVSSPRGGAGGSGDVPSLRQAIRLPNGTTGRSLAVGTSIYCTDCHNNSAARAFGGSGSNGPHGSENEHLLVLPYPVNTALVAPGSLMNEVNSNYPLCNMCHFVDRSESPNAVLNDGTFGEHEKHVRGAGLSCSNCHDGHGIQGGTLNGNRALINFDLDRVAPLPGRAYPEFNSRGLRKGACYLSCHDKAHDGLSY